MADVLMELNLAVVAIAFGVIVLGAYTSLSLAQRARANVGQVRYRWLAASSLLMGIAIWSMHFLALAAIQLPVHVTFAIRSMLIALILAVPLIGSAYLPLCVERPGAVRIGLAGVIMGLGICVIHYLGMNGLRGAFYLSYDPVLVAASAFLAASSASATLLLVVRKPGRWSDGISAFGLGIAIAGTHFIGMAATRFNECAPKSAEGHAPIGWIATGIAAATVLLFLYALLATVFDRRLEELAARETATVRRGEQRLRDILEQLPIGICVTDNATKEALVANRQAHAMLGRDVDPDVFSRSSTGDGSGVAPPASASCIDPCTGAGDLLEYQRPDGERITLETFSAPVLDDFGRPVLTVTAFQDVTKRLRAEADFRQAQKMDAVGQLTGGVAHDFNNLLTAVLGNLELLQAHLAGETSRTLLRNAIEATERGARLTGQLLGFARRQALHPEPVDVEAVVAGMTTLLASTLGGTIRIRTEAMAGLWPALADRTQLDLVVLNLAINARDALPYGGTILIGSENVRLGAPAGPNDPAAGDYVMLSVRDDGTGMSPDVLARVFEPFFTTKAPGKGSGLGLSQVLGIAQQLGGGVRIFSEPGCGTTIQVFMPRGHVPAASNDVEAGPAPSRPAELGGRLILLVDDDLDVRRATSATLAQFGCRVIEASSGAEAIEIVLGRGETLDAVVMDHAMPGMTGVEAAERLMVMQPGLPVLLVTGYADPEHLGLSGTILPVLLKPFRGAALAERLSALLPPERDGASIVSLIPGKARARSA